MLEMDDQKLLALASKAGVRELKDQELSALISNLDDELYAEGIIDPRQRHFHLPVRAMERLGYISFSLTGPYQPALLRRIRVMHRTRYRPKDVAVGELHGGVFMFRGIAVEVRVPLSYGSIRIDPLEHNDLSAPQTEWLASDPEQVEAYVSTFCDIFDFGACIYSFGDYDPPPEACKGLA